MKIRYLFVLFITMLTSSAFSQNRWSLERCIEYAKSNNLEIKQKSLMVKLAKDDLFQKNMNLLPSITAYLSHAYNYGQAIDRYTNQFAAERVQSNNFYLQSGITLFNGFQKLNQIKQSRTELDVLKAENEKLSNDISLSIAAAYLQIIYNKELVNIRKSQLELTLKEVEKIEKLVSVGHKASGDLLSMQAQYSNEESNYIDSKNRLQLSFLILKHLLDLPSDSDFDIEVPDIDLNITELELKQVKDIYEFALSNRPEIKIFENRLQSAIYGLKMAKGAYFPTLSLTGSIGTGYSGASNVIESIKPEIKQIGFFVNENNNKTPVFGVVNDVVYKRKSWTNQINDNLNKTIGLNLNIPIFSNWLINNNVKRSFVFVESAKINLELQKKQLYKNIEQAQSDVILAMEHYKSLSKKVDALNELYRYASEKYNVGLYNSIDYNNAKKDFSIATSEKIQSKYDYLFKNMILNFYLNKPLTIFNNN